MKQRAYFAGTVIDQKMLNNWNQTIKRYCYTNQFIDSFWRLIIEPWAYLGATELAQRNDSFTVIKALNCIKNDKLHGNFPKCFLYTCLCRTLSIGRGLATDKRERFLGHAELRYQNRNISASNCSSMGNFPRWEDLQPKENDLRCIIGS